jgi:adenosylmethionine-8-amino-7-oxononanoate aminotransferase
MATETKRGRFPASLVGTVSKKIKTLKPLPPPPSTLSLDELVTQLADEIKAKSAECTPEQIADIIVKEITGAGCLVDARRVLRAVRERVR